MRLEELENRWRTLDEKIEGSLKLEKELLRLTVLGTARTRVDRQAVWPALDVAFGGAAALFAGSFLGDHRGDWPLVALAGVLGGGGVVLAADGVRQLVRLGEIDWGGTVADIQSSLSRVGMAKVRQFRWVILLAPLMGFCALILALQRLLDRSPAPRLILDRLDPAWVIVNLAFGVLFVPVGHLVFRLLAARFSGRAWWRSVIADISGTSLGKTREELARWSKEID